MRANNNAKRVGDKALAFVLGPHGADHAQAVRHHPYVLGRGPLPAPAPPPLLTEARARRLLAKASGTCTPTWGGVHACLAALVHHQVALGYVQRDATRQPAPDGDAQKPPRRPDKQRALARLLNRPLAALARERGPRIRPSVAPSWCLWKTTPTTAYRIRVQSPVHRDPVRLGPVGPGAHQLEQRFLSGELFIRYEPCPTRAMRAMLHPSSALSARGIPCFFSPHLSTHRSLRARGTVPMAAGRQCTDTCGARPRPPRRTS